VSPEGLIKMLKFGLWVDYKQRNNSAATARDVIMDELQFYKTLGMKEEFKVNWKTLHCTGRPKSSA
jgi:hypothetical protein